MSSRRFSLIAVFLVSFASGCFSLPTRVESRLPPAEARGVVIVVDGAGRRQHAARNIANCSDNARMGLYVRSFDWGHGFGLGLADVVNAGHARKQGQCLAEEVRRAQAQYPGCPVSLVAHSAGCAVVLAAAESLPADSLDRVILLAPACSPCRDLSRALVSPRRGMDVFTSERDWFYLGLGTTITGTPDGGRGSAAGRVGFEPPSHSALAARLRQHPWNASQSQVGHRGGHSGTLEPGFIDAYLLPLLAPQSVSFSPKLRSH